MKTLSKAMFATTAALAMTVSANAAVSYGSSVGQPYVGVKVSQFDVDVAGAPKSTGYGVYGGYNFDQHLGAEVEYQASEKKDYSIGAARYEYDVKSFGAYGTYRQHLANTPFYAKGKLGVANTKIADTGTNNTFSNKEDKTSLAGGVSVGYAPNQNFGIEAGYNYLNSEANAITVGAHIAF